MKQQVLETEVANLRITLKWSEAEIEILRKRMGLLTSNPHGEGNHPLPPMEEYTE